MLHAITITRRTDLASAPWEITVNGAAIDLIEKLPTQRHVDQAIEQYAKLLIAEQDEQPAIQQA